MKHTSVLLTEEHINRIKDTGSSSSEIIRKALDLYFGTDQLDLVRRLIREEMKLHVEVYHMPPIAHDTGMTSIPIDAHETGISSPMPEVEQETVITDMPTPEHEPDIKENMPPIAHDAGIYTTGLAANVPTNEHEVSIYHNEPGIDQPMPEVEHDIGIEENEHETGITPKTNITNDELKEVLLYIKAEVMAGRRPQPWEIYEHFPSLNSSKLGKALRANGVYYKEGARGVGEDTAVRNRFLKEHLPAIDKALADLQM
jgi:hypothetical protein